MRIADDEADAGERRDLFGGTLGVAAGHHNFCFGILSAHAADRGSRILIRTRRHRAGIHDDHGSLRGSRRACQPALFELAFEGGAVSLSDTAAEILYIVSGHVPMVTHPSASPTGIRPKPQSSAT